MLMVSHGNDVQDSRSDIPGASQPVRRVVPDDERELDSASCIADM